MDSFRTNSGLNSDEQRSLAFVDSQKRLDSLMYTAKRGMKQSSGKKPRDFLRDLK